MSADTQEPNDPTPTAADARAGDTEPYTVWSALCPFRKNGTPVLGTMGATARSVVVIDADTFTRLVAEHPSLATAPFRVGKL